MAFKKRAITKPNILFRYNYKSVGNLLNNKVMTVISESELLRDLDEALDWKQAAINNTLKENEMSLLEIRELKIQKIFTDPIEAILASKQKWGLGFYAKSHEDWKIAQLKASGDLYLDEHECLWYINHETSILKLFSWSGCLRSGGVSIASIDTDKMKIYFTPCDFDRDSLRKSNFIWTLDY